MFALASFFKCKRTIKMATDSFLCFFFRSEFPVSFVPFVRGGNDFTRTCSKLVTHIVSSYHRDLKIGENCGRSLRSFGGEPALI